MTFYRVELYHYCRSKIGRGTIRIINNPTFQSGLNDKNFQIFNILVKYKKKSITFVAKTEFMRARIMFDWAGNVYDWDIDWPLPFFPRKGIISYLQFPMFV